MTAPAPVCQHCCGTGKRPVTDYDRFKAEHPEELAKAEAELNAEMAPPAPVCHDGWHVGDGETCVCGSYKTPPAPDCAMCGHAAHERDCETKVLREQIPCGCQFWAEGWKLTAPPAPERMSEEERSVPLVYMSVEATRENVEMHYPAPERMTNRLYAEQQEARAEKAEADARECHAMHRAETARAERAEAEVEALKATRDRDMNRHTEAAIEIRQLRDMRDKYEALAREFTNRAGNAEAEVERLKATAATLRGALEKIAARVCDCCDDIAREALEGK